MSSLVTLLSVVIAIGFLAGIAYAFVAIPAQTELQEEIDENVRGRVFGILNMLISIGSLLPIVVVAPIADDLRADAGGHRPCPHHLRHRAGVDHRARRGLRARRQAPAQAEAGTGTGGAEAVRKAGQAGAGAEALGGRRRRRRDGGRPALRDAGLSDEP